MPQFNIHAVCRESLIQTDSNLQGSSSSWAMIDLKIISMESLFHVQQTGQAVITNSHTPLQALNGIDDLISYIYIKSHLIAIVGKGLESRELCCYWEHLAETKEIYGVNIERKVKRPGVAGSQTQDTSGLSHQCSATRTGQPPIPTILYIYTHRVICWWSLHPVAWYPSTNLSIRLTHCNQTPFHSECIQRLEKWWNDTFGSSAITYTKHLSTVAEQGLYILQISVFPTLMFPIRIFLFQILRWYAM